MKVKLNNRLMAVASLIPKQSSLIDIGCDHALLSIYVAQNLEPRKVIASDIKEGPLEHAKANIKKYQVENKIKIKLGKGVEPIEEDIDTIVISGMGGLNMIGILKYEKEKYKNVNTLILSPNSDTKEIRKEICKLGFYMEEEKLVKENHIIYLVIRFQRGKRNYHQTDYLYGPILIRKQDSLFLEYMNKEREKKEKLLQVLPKKYLEKKWKLKHELKMITKIMKANKN